MLTRMSRYGDQNLDRLLKCTIEDNSCIKIAILEGGSDTLEQAHKSPPPTNNFKYNTLEGTWYKDMGYNPNYDCYTSQCNTCMRNRLSHLRTHCTTVHILSVGDSTSTLFTSRKQVSRFPGFVISRFRDSLLPDF
jgi:hypothetical protein